MSCIGLGQAAQVDKLICTNLDISGSIITPNQQNYGSATTPLDIQSGSPVIIVGNVNIVNLYVWNSIRNALDFQLVFTTPSVRNHSFTVTNTKIDIIGNEKTIKSYSIYPTPTSTSNTAQFGLKFNELGPIYQFDAQRITVTIVSDS